MWVLYGLLPTVLVLGVIVAGAAALFRGRGDGRGIEFPTVVAAYVALVMLVSVFLVAAGVGLLVKAGLATAASRDFSYNTQTYTPYDPTTRSNSTPVDPSDDSIRNDVATGISLAFAGFVLAIPHALGGAILRRRAHISTTVPRGAALLGLAASTLALLAAGASALNDILREYVLGGTDKLLPYQQRHPGNPLSVAIVMAPLVAWFGWQLWREFTHGNGQTAAVASTEPA